MRALGLLLAGALVACEGTGDAGEGLRIRNRSIAEGCTPAAGSFPSGLAILPEPLGLAAMVQTSPPGLVVFDVDRSPPAALSFVNISTDSDGDGIDDDDAIEPLLGFPLAPTMGEIQAFGSGLALVSTSNYEQVLVVDPRTGQPIDVTVEVPFDVPPERYPLLPPPGERATRTGISTLACVIPPVAEDSEEQPLAPDPRCDAKRPSFLTNLTAGKALAGGRLFVATSNLLRDARFLPGTVLVFDWIEAGGALTVRPSVETPVLFPTGFNPTGMTSFETPGGRELVLVTVTGAIGTESGPSNVRSESSLDVIDPSVPRIVATIPLGFAGPSFDAPAVDPRGTTAWLGASSQRRLYAVDLRALDTPALYQQSGPPAILDGRSPGLDDARIFTADRPLLVPDRLDRPAPPSCAGFTHVALDAAGSQALVTDFCDGTLTRVRLDPSGDPPVPFPAERFRVAGQTKPFAPNDAVGELRAPGALAVRPGIPGVDFTAPDLWVVAGQPDAQLCGLRVELP